MAVTRGNISSSSGNVASLAWSHTTATGGTEIRVCVSLAAGESVSTVVWDVGGTPISGTLIRAEQNTGSVRAEIWEINGTPSASTADITVTPATKARLIAGAADFIGADADTGSDDAGNSADGVTTATVSPLNVTSDDFVVDALAIGGNEGANTGANQTDIYNTGFHSTIGGAASTQDGTDGAAMSWTGISSNDIAIAGCRVPAAGVAATGSGPLLSGKRNQAVMHP